MLQLFSALQEHGLNLLIANGFLDSTKGQPAVGNGLWNELAICWLVWPGLNAAINSCRSGSQWEYGPWRNSLAVCGHFFWPIFCLKNMVGWAGFCSLNGLKIQVARCQGRQFDVRSYFWMLSKFASSVFFQNFGQACGWVGGYRDGSSEWQAGNS